MQGTAVWDEDNLCWVSAATIANAGATYTATEQGIINSIIAALKNAGIIALD